MTDEIIIGHKILVAFKSPTISSRVKITAAIGVLKAAATPAADPVAKRAFTFLVGIAVNSPIEPTPELMATIGPQDLGKSLKPNS